MIVNGYKPLDDWWVLAAICLSMMLIGAIVSQLLDPLPENMRIVQDELMKCHQETQEVCSLVTMPASSFNEVQLLYSKYVK